MEIELQAHLGKTSTRPEQEEFPARSARRKAHLREASFADYAEISQLESRHGLRNKTRDQWLHLWIDNPVYKRLDGKFPIGWVLESGEGQVVGSFGNIPLSYHFGPQNSVLAAAGHAWVVDVEYRGYSLSLLLRFFRQRDTELFLNTSSNEAASKAFLALGAEPVPLGRWDMAAYWAVNHDAVARAFLRARGLSLASVLSVPMATVARLQDFLCGGRGGRRPELEIQEHSHFDSRIDEFWERLRRERPNMLLATRTSEALQWHFHYALQSNNAWIISASRGTKMLGYCVFLREDRSDFGLRRIRLVDFQALECPAELLLSIIEWAYARCRREDIHMIELLGCGIPKNQAFERQARFRQLPAWCYFYRVGRASLCEALRDPAIWDPSLLDGDATL